MVEQLVVNITAKTREALIAAADLGQQSPTDAINKAIQTYALLLQIEHDGGWLLMKATRETELLERLRVF